MTVYVNGLAAAHSNRSLGYTGTGPLVIGRQGELAEEYFDGLIDDLRFYGAPLSAQQVQAVMAAPQ